MAARETGLVRVSREKRLLKHERQWAAGSHLAPAGSCCCQLKHQSQLVAFTAAAAFAAALLSAAASRLLAASAAAADPAGEGAAAAAGGCKRWPRGAQLSTKRLAASASDADVF